MNLQINFPFSSKKLFNFILCFTVLALSLSCNTTSHDIKSAVIISPSSNLLQEADQYFQREQYHTALVKYSAYVYSPFPDKKDMDHARYQLALCHYFLEQYPEAYETLSSLLKEHPNFSMAEQAREIQAKCKNLIENKEIQQEKSQKALQNKIVQTKKLIESDPKNANYHYHLADLYWSGGLVQKAVEEYGIAAKLDPKLLQGENLRHRVRITDSGEFKVRDPMLEFAEDKVLKVVDSNLQRVKKSNWLGETESLRISGVVENTGLRDVKNVSIEVTIYNFDDVVQDTKVYKIGTIRAGAQRPFSVIMNNFSGDARDIHKYTCQLLYKE